MSKTRRELFIDQLEFRDTTPVPYARLDFEDEVAAKMDEYFGSDSWRSTIVQAHIGMPGCRIIEREEDVFVDEYGITWRTGTGAMHIEKPPLSQPSLKELKLPKPEEICTDEVLAKIEKTITENPDRLSVSGWGWGIFERTWSLRGFENSLLDIVAEPAFYEDLLEAVTQHQLAMVERLCQTSLDAIWYSDDWGDQRGVIIGAERWRQFLKPQLAKLYRAAQKAGKYRISHCCGNIKEIIGDCVEIGLNCLQSVQPEAMNPYELKKEFNGKMAFWGGLGSQSTIPFGTPDDIKKEVRKLCDVMAKGGGYILGPAKTVLNDTPVENAVAVFEAFKEEFSRG